MAEKRRAELAVPVEDEGDLLRIRPLGAGREVGRSCILLQYKGKTVMLDCGLHAGHEGINSLPFFDDVDPETVDLLLVTHFHTDHAAAVPYYLEKTTFRGRTFMTRPTKGVFRWLATDYIRVTNTSNSDSAALYTEADLIKAHAKIEEIDMHQQVEVSGIKFTAYNAGHVLGAAMFLIEIAGVRVLYTGDYSREEDRHLIPAENPGVSVNVLITESTFGLHNYEPRVDREKALMKHIRDIVRRRGSCLLPVTALGRTQELLLILEEYWRRHINELEGVPVFFISALGKTGTRLYKQYVMDMSQRIQRQLSRTGQNPFDFRYIKTRTSASEVPDSGPCVVLATPGMLQSGVSRQLLERWAPRPENGLIITGYSVEGTLAREINNSMDDIPALSGGKIPRRIAITNISFSAHVDGAQNCAFIDEIRAPFVVLVHGEENAMMRLRANLVDKYRDSDYEISVHTPRNTQAVDLHFHGEKIARVKGGLASKAPAHGECVAGILVEKDFNYTLVDTADLHEFTGIAPVVIEQQQRVPYASSFGLLRLHLEQMFGELPLTTEQSNSGTTHTLRVYDAVDVTHSSWKTHVEVEWESNIVNDMAADSVVAVVLNTESSPASVKITQGPGCGHSHGHGHSHDPASGGCDADGHAPLRSDASQDVASRLPLFLLQHFSQVTAADDGSCVTVCHNGLSAAIDTHTLEIQSDSQPLKERIAPLVAQVRRALRPLARRAVAPPKEQPTQDPSDQPVPDPEDQPVPDTEEPEEDQPVPDTEEPEEDRPASDTEGPERPSEPEGGQKQPDGGPAAPDEDGDVAMAAGSGSGPGGSSSDEPLAAQIQPGPGAA
ncbi:endoribonuclease ysh1 [Coemansia javaensis]|uniref:Endoribonuclease ysh1 n=1 Tax=Coemansia javaensis TaxID=2761396 RepID=A0A9W8HDG5_9FUNG|nr:endoribonuclease ysh1 [Coemansia javaensis]